MDIVKMQSNNNSPQQLYRHGVSSSSSPDTQQNPSADGLQDIAGAPGNHQAYAGMQNLTSAMQHGLSQMMPQGFPPMGTSGPYPGHHFATPTGYPMPGPSNHHAYQMPNPASAPYTGHHWYQHQMQMQNAGNHYGMPDDPLLWQHPMFSSSTEYVDMFGSNCPQNVNMLPSPPVTVSSHNSNSSSPDLESVAPRAHQENAVGNGIRSASGLSRLVRPAAPRSPYGWMKRTAHQALPNPGKTRTKDKYRIVYTDHQRIELEKEFTFINKYITIRRKTELALTLGLSERQIKIWFQNRRAKERKQLKKRHEENNASHIHGDPIRRVPRNFANIPAFMDTMDGQQMVQRMQTHHDGQAQQPVNVPAGGGLLTPPSGSEDGICRRRNNFEQNSNPQT